MPDEQNFCKRRKDRPLKLRHKDAKSFVKLRAFVCWWQKNQYLILLIPEKRSLKPNRNPATRVQTCSKRLDKIYTEQPEYVFKSGKDFEVIVSIIHIKSVCP